MKATKKIANDIQKILLIGLAVYVLFDMGYLALESTMKKQQFVDAKVVHHLFIPDQQVPVTEKCKDAANHSDCLYYAKPSRSIYGLVIQYQDQASVIAVPRSYFYTISRGDHVPLQVEKSIFSGETINTKIIYPKNYESGTLQKTSKRTP